MSQSEIEPRAFLTVHSQFTSIELVQAVVEDLLVQVSMGEECRHWIGLALREAMANAIKHGNGIGDKHVEVEVCCDDEEVVLRIRDQGGGFDPDSVDDPLAPENLLKTCGRGIFYMRRLMDEVDFRFAEGGTEVMLRKRIVPDEGTEEVASSS